MTIALRAWVGGPAHIYLSTTCWHALRDPAVADHDRCRLVCKWCKSLCRCDCHREADES